ncbi:MAG: hypothetical protein M1836_005762 [Candelina mexicana]|nr:MAG: hypothetical protein M1836_005762 [Candelina mexicana]
MPRTSEDTAAIDDGDVQEQTLLSEELPSGYYRSRYFIGSLVATGVMAIGLFIEYSMPVRCRIPPESRDVVYADTGKTSSLAIINADIGPAPNIVLISTIPTVISGVCIVIVGRLSDLFGRRYFLIIGQILGLIGSTIAATATSIPRLIGGGVLIGIAASVQQTLTFIIAELVPNKHRPIANGAVLLVTLPSAGLGPGFARIIVENTKQGWRWFYYLSIICAGSSLLLFILFYFPPNFRQLHRKTTKRAELNKLDYVGLIMFTGGLVILLLGLSWGGTSYSWTSGHVLGTIITGVVAILAFAFYGIAHDAPLEDLIVTLKQSVETFAPLKQTFLPLDLLKNRNYIAILVTSSVATMIYFSMNVIWPQQIAALYTTDNIQIGWLSCTIGTSLVVGYALCGLLFRPLGHAQWQLVACSMAMTAFLGGMAASDQSNRALAIAFTICGTLAVGYCELGTLIMGSLVCKPEDIGFAVGFITSTIYQTILTNRLNTNIPNLVTPPALSANLPSTSLPALFAAFKIGTPEALQTVPGITPAVVAAVTEPLKTAYAQSFKVVYLASIAFGGCAIVAACFARDVDRLMTDRVARVLRGVDHSDDGSSRDAGEDKAEDGSWVKETKV